MRIEVFPSAVELDSARSEVQLVVTGHYHGGATRDLTSQARLEVHAPQIARMKQQRLVATGNGATSLLVSFSGKEVTVPIRVRNADLPDPIHFQFETVAAITKQGCNSGSCHGSPQGKGGFALSLFAYDPESDQESLVRGGLNRRVNRLVPEESLLLKKPLLRTSHGGGKRLRKQDLAFSILRQWIEEGAHVRRPQDISCTGIVVTPTNSRIVYAPARRQQLNVTAHFSDGRQRDVTRLAAYNTTNKQVATVDANGLITCRTKGQSAITIRYLNHFESLHITYVISDNQFRWQEPTEYNSIDRVINNRLKLLQYQPAPICSDSVFLRRVHLDLTGLLPSVERARRFLRDPTPDKRSRLVDELLDGKEFSRFQALQLADLLHVNAQVLGEHRAQLFADWIVEGLNTNNPYDQFTRQLLTSSGNSSVVAPANYFSAIASTEEVSEAIAQVFMGSRIQCAKCHNHPFENWTQNDYYRLAAVFHRVECFGTWVNIKSTGEMTHPKSGKAMRPWGVDDEEVPRSESTEDSVERRVAFAKWLTKKTNPYFAPVAVNRIWDQLFGRGIVNPIDDFRSSNPPVNVELLDILAKVFRDTNFDRKHLIRFICNSATYQHSTETNASNLLDDQFFSHARIRLLTAEQLQDATGLVTGCLPPIEQVEQMDDDNRQQLERLANEHTTQQPAWEREQRQSLEKLPLWHGDWWSLPAYTEDSFDQAYERGFSPEERQVATPNQSREKAADPLGIDPLKNHGGRHWQLEESWKPDGIIPFTEQPNVAHYVYHRVFANQTLEATVDFKSTDGAKIWRNGDIVLESKEGKKWKEDIRLSRGWNHFLIKIVNADGICHFYFSVKTSSDLGPQPEVPGYIAAALVTPSQQRTTEQVSAIKTYHLDLNDSIRQLRRRVLLGLRFDYATQRPYPEQTPFLTAFGQPERTSPCACDRSNEPNLEQAIQLLNGQGVVNRIDQGVQAYQDLSNEEFVETICLAAYSRFPHDGEKQKMLEWLIRADDRDHAIADILWAVMATQEFMFQH